MLNLLFLGPALGSEALGNGPLRLPPLVEHLPHTQPVNMEAQLGLTVEQPRKMAWDTTAVAQGL